MQPVIAYFRFYEELNDFLPAEKRKIVFPHSCTPNAAVKDIIESLGIPHTEVDLILANGKSVNFSYQIQDGDYISVYPVFEVLDISPLVKLRPDPLRETRFILDVHLGKLAKFLRLLGFDTLYENDYSDNDIIDKAKEEGRIILTRDVGLLKNKKVTHAYWLRETDPKEQVSEVVKYFNLIQQCHPFTRCMECNGMIEPMDKDIAIKKVPPLVKELQLRFYQCTTCQRIYWQGTHYQKLKAFIEKIKSQI